MEEQFQQQMHHHHHHQSFGGGPAMMTHAPHDYRNDIDVSAKMIDDMRMNIAGMGMVKSEPLPPHYPFAQTMDHRLHYSVPAV